jgi:hypothetical protein
MLLCWGAQNSYGAENLECPEIGATSVPDLMGDASGGGLFVSENGIDLANEINEAINRLQLANPNISWSDAQNVLVASYCRVVARKGGLTAAEKWDRMRQFDNVVERQVAANMMPAGTLIIASVPLPPDVFRELRKQARQPGKLPGQLSCVIFGRAGVSVHRVNDLLTIPMGFTPLLELKQIAGLDLEQAAFDRGGTAQPP